MTCFNSRASCEARRGLRPIARPAVRFQFTRLLRGATFAGFAGVAAGEFQFTRLLRGATSPRQIPFHIRVRFNSRASCEARLAVRSPWSPVALMFQFTRLLRGATGHVAALSRDLRFNSRASCEARRGRY